MTFTKRTLFTCAITCLLAFSGTVGADEPMRVTNAAVSVLCPLTVGGSFEATTKSVSGEVVAPSDTQVVAGNTQLVKGELAVDLRTLETGISLRDKHMRSNYLEVERGAEFAHAKLKDIRVERLAGKTTFRGMLTLHGQQKEVNGTAEINPKGDAYHLVATFPVRVSDFSIPEPTYLGVGVKDEIQVRVTFTTAPATTVAHK